MDESLKSVEVCKFKLPNFFHCLQHIATLSQLGIKTFKSYARQYFFGI